MASNRPDEYPSLMFAHRGHEFLITAVPEGADITLHIADRYGRILLPLLIRIPAVDVRRGRGFDRRPIDAGMAELRKAIEEFDHTRFRELLNAPRAASDFEWTPAELDAASRIDWSKPAATIVHEGYRFSIGAFTTEQRMVFLLRDADGPFDAPMSIPGDSMVRAAMNGNDPVTIGVRTMIAQIRAWNAARTAAFVKDAPRLSARQRAG